MKLSRSISQVSCTAEPTLAMVLAPASTGDMGRIESPSRKVTLSMGRPSASADSCVIEV
jgi:hypothetical protein